MESTTAICAILSDRGGMPKGHVSPCFLVSYKSLNHFYKNIDNIIKESLKTFPKKFV